MLELVEVTGGWGPTTIVDRVSLRVETGETLAILGRNGVGKTTLMELIVNRARLASGAIRLDGRELSGLSTHQRARAGLGYVPQAREVFKSLTVAEHFEVAGRPGRWTKSAVYELFPSLAERRSSRAGQLSGGEQQMLAIARALLCNPAVLLMDEPSEGLAPVVVDQLIATVRRLMDERAMAIVLVEQRLDIALELGDRYAILDRGRVTDTGAVADLRRLRERLPALMGLDAE